MFSKIISSIFILALTAQANAATQTFKCNKGSESYVLIVSYEHPAPLEESLGKLVLVNSNGESVYKNEILIDEFSTPTRCGSIYSLGGENSDGDSISIYKEFNSPACGAHSIHKKSAAVNGLSCY